MYYPKGVTLDGASDYLLRSSGLTGASDTNVGTCCFWVLPPSSAPAAEMTILTNALQRFRVYIDTDGTLHVVGYTSAGALILHVKTSSSICDGVPHSILISWSQVAQLAYIYVDDTNATSVVGGLVSANLDYTDTAWAIGANTDGTNKFAGALSELWFYRTELRMTTESNRRKFIGAGSQPVRLGADGSLPYFKPWIYIGPPPIGTNYGSGGDFTAQGSPILWKGPYAYRSRVALNG